MGYRWLRDDSVVAMIKEAMDERLKALGPIALDVVRDIPLSEHASPQTRLQAARDVLDRLGWMPPRGAERIEGEQGQLEEMTLQELEELASGRNGVCLDEQSLEQLASIDP